MSSAAEAAKPNRLINEKSPYLLQHAHNPVDWYPWGPEAFEKARREDKPLLISIGYSTCHWCHVMERESYEDPQVAKLMNTYFVNIKVDREERPDVDKIYMTAVSAMTGSGGWPLNVFVTPDLKPFVGGTYFPPVSRGGMPGWSAVVTKIGESWKDPEERKKIIEAGQQVTEALQKYAAAEQEPLEGKAEWLDDGMKALKASYDASNGGFGRAPKFPMPVYHHFLLRYASSSRHSPRSLAGNPSDVYAIVEHTLREMARGGIYDHLGGGFARYSTDASWRVPHFEKMLYDNAQLAAVYLEAYQYGKEPYFREVARETLDYVLRDMTSKEGGFYSAEDADSLPPSAKATGGKADSSAEALAKAEGAFYVWEKKEITDLLGPEAWELFTFRYGVRDTGNAPQDPHGEFTNKNILYAAHPIAETAKQFKRSEEDTRKALDQAKKTLFEARKKRPRPHLDDKVLSAWNGLMISAFAKGYQVLGEENDLRAAQAAARFLKANLYDPKEKKLYRSWREGKRGKASGIADDYAFVVQGLLDLYEADFDPSWLAWAAELNDVLVQRFSDKGKGGFYMTASDQDAHLLLRVKEDADNVEPSASSVAALNLLRLEQFTDKKEYGETARKTLKAFGTTLKETPQAMPFMLSALQYSLASARQVVIAGKPGAPDTQALLKVLNNAYIPVKIVILVDPDNPTALSNLPSYIRGMKPLSGQAAAYLCQNYTCKKPTADPQEFEKQLKN